ncbi:CAP domain-containing protein [Coraliomargarita sp. W4R72]
MPALFATPSDSAPPAVFIDSIIPEIAVGSSVRDSGEAAQMRSFALESDSVSAAQFGTGVSVWEEGAENGLTYVSDESDVSYDLIQSDRVAKGSYAFHLAHSNASDNWFELDVDIDVLADTQLFFQSRLQYATSAQSAQVQVSYDGGSSWPDTIYSQAGAGVDDSGEGVFILRVFDLGASYANQQIRIRFYYDYAGGSYYPQSDTHIGWLVDDIQISNDLEKTEWLIGEPTPDEVLYLEILNRARVDAMVEAARLAALTNPLVTAAYSQYGISSANIIAQFQWSVDNGVIAASAQPLAFNARLMESSQKHSQDMYNNDFQAHDSSSNPVAPFQAGDTLSDRLNRVGYVNIAAGENVYASARSAEHGHAGFDVDWGNTVNTSSANYNPDFAGQGMQNPAGHRISIHKGSFNEVGVGVVNGSNGSVGPQIVTQDFGGAIGVSYITGLVYNDTNEDGFYTVTDHTVHEGRGDVRIDIAGSALYTTSTSSGAYAIPVEGDGTYTVTFSGEGLESLTTTIVVAGGLNTKFDHQPVELSGFAQWQYENDLVGGIEEDDDFDGIANLIEYAVAGMSADTFDAAQLPSLIELSDGSRIFTVNKRSGVNDVEYVVQVSTGLNGVWESPSEVVGVSIMTNDTNELTLRVEASVPQIFLRLQVTQIP